MKPFSLESIEATGNTNRVQEIHELAEFSVGAKQKWQSNDDEIFFALSSQLGPVNRSSVSHACIARYSCLHIIH
jgi:hypothetical protein